jgi:hypothetical protein
MGKKFEGALLALVSIPPEIIGLVILNKNRSRRSEIEKYIINNMGIKFGLKIREEQIVTDPVFGFQPGFTITFRFNY